MPAVANRAACKCVPLDQLPAFRDGILARAAAAGLKGTVLLAAEGINLFLAGPEPGIDAFLHGLRADPRFADLDVKFSVSDTVPFRRLRVKIKREIIRSEERRVGKECASKCKHRWMR